MCYRVFKGCEVSEWQGGEDADSSWAICESATRDESCSGVVAVVLLVIYH